jgi:hypothetical protein
MNLKTTLALVVLVAGGAVLYFLGPDLAVSLGLVPKPAPAGTGETQAILRDEFKPQNLSRIDIQQGDRRWTFERAGADWTLPGRWSAHKAEVEQLVELLTTGLQSRFAPIALTGEPPDLAAYGLDKPAVTVTVRAGSKDYQLAFGEEPEERKKPEERDNRFSRPTYLRLGDNGEVLRLRPGLIAALTRPLAYYQQRRLFLSERVARDTDPTEKVEQLLAKAVEVKEVKPEEDKDKKTEDKKDGKPEAVSYTLNKVDGEWQLSEPQPDRPNPDRLRTILTALPDVWAERFVEGPGDNLKEYGLQDPVPLTIRVTKPDGQIVTLLVGKESRRERGRDLEPEPLSPLAPKMPQEETIYHYAKLQDNKQIFEVKYNKVQKDVLVAFADLRDPRVARFRTSDAKALEVSYGDQKLALSQDKNRWQVQEPFKAEAETGKVNELLDKLTDLEARDKADVSYESKPDVDGLDKPAGTITVKVEEEVKGEGDAKTKKTRELVFEVGKQDKTKLYVRLKGGKRISAVDPGLLDLVKRPALAYRGRRVLDFLTGDLTQLEIKRAGETFTLKQDKGDWQLAIGEVKAEADRGSAGRLAGDLSTLDAVEFVTAKADPKDLDEKYGLAKPALSAKVTFKKDDKPTEKEVLIGKKRDDKDEFFAKLADADEVFVVRKDLVEDLDKGSLGLRPLAFKRVETGDIDTLRVQKRNEPEYRLSRKGADWQISGPFTASAVPIRAMPLATELGGLRAERYVTHAASDEELKKYGLDQPYLRLVLTPVKKDGADAKKDGDAKAEWKERILLIGGPTDKDAATRYAKLEDDRAVFVVGAKLVAAVDRGALDLLDPRLIDCDLDDVRRIERTEGDKRLILELKDKDWQVAEPPFTADQLAVNRFLVAVTGLNAERYAAYDRPKEELKDKYGLEPPAWTLTVNVRVANPADKEKAEKAGPPEKYTLLVGKPVEGGKGERYARLDDGKGGPVSKGVVVLGDLTVKDLSISHLDFVDRKVLDLKPDTVTGVQLRVEGLKGHDLQMLKIDGAWEIDKPAKQKADDSTLELLVQQLATLRANRVAEYPAKNPQNFGLDKPELTVKLYIGGEKKMIELKVGKAADETSGDRFAQLVDSDKVVVLSGDLARRLFAPPLKFRDHTLARSTDDVNRIVLERGDQKTVFVRTDGVWKRLLDNVEVEVDHEALEDFVNSAARFRADELVADKPADLKPYGLDQPQARWRLLAGDKEVLVLALGQKEGPRCYAKLEPGDLVFFLDAKETGQLLTQQFRNRRLWPPLDPDQIEKIVYKDFTLERQGDQWQIAGKPAERVEADRVRETLSALANLKAERWEADKSADLKRYGLDQPQKIEVVLRKGKRSLFVGSSEGPGKGSYVRVGADTPTSDVQVLSAADVARIVRTPQGFTTPPRPPGGFPPIMPP